MHDTKKAQRRAPDPADTLRHIDEVLRLSRSAVWEVDRDGVFTYVSASFEDLLGYRPEEVVGQRAIHEFYPEESSPELESELTEDWIGKGEEFSQLALPLLAKSGEIVWVSSSGMAVRDADGKIIGFRGVDRDITPFKLAEENLRQSEQSLWDQIQKAPVPMAFTTLAGAGVLQVNEAFVRTFGYAREEVATVEDWFVRAYPDPADREQVQRDSEEWIAQAARGEVLQPREYRITCRDGRVLDVEVGAALVAGKFVGTFTDVTSRRRELEQRKAREEELRRVLDNLPFPVATSVAGPDFDWQDARARVTYLNRRFTDVFGFTLPDIPTVSDWARLALPDEKTRHEIFATLDEQVQAALRGAGEVGPVEVRVAAKGGAMRDVLIQAVAVGSQLVISLEDITERKRAEDDLRAREAELFRILDNLPFPVTVSVIGSDGAWRDPKNKLVFLNRRHIEAFGYTVEDCPTVGAYTMRAYPDASYRDEILAHWDRELPRALREGSEPLPQESKLTTKSGEVRDVEISAIIIGGKMVTCFQDVTERNRDRAQLAESEERFRKMFEEAPVAMTSTDRKTGLVLMNAAYEALLGYRRDKTWTREALADDVLRASGVSLREWDEAKRFARERGEVLRREMRLTAQDGSVREVELTSISLPGADSNVMVDLTERNAVLRDLQGKEELLRSLVAFAPVPIAFTRPGEHRVYTNRAFEEAYGWKADDLPTTDAWFTKAYPDDDYRREVLAQWEPLVEQARHTDGRVPPREYRVTAKDGSVHEVEISAVILGDVLVGTFIDLTESKRTRAELVERSKRLNFIIENTPVPIAYTAGGGELIRYNKSFAHAYGWTTEDAPVIEEWFVKAYPDENYRREVLGQWMAGLRQAEQTDGRIPPREYRVTAKDGSVHEVEISAIIFGGEMFGTFLDLTERNRAERLLRERQEQLARVGRVSTLGQFAALLAHELEQPLGAMLNNAEAAKLLLARETPDVGELRSIVEDILADDRRAGAVLDRIRGIVKGRTFEPHKVPVEQLLHEVARLLRPLASARGISLEISCEPGTPAIDGDMVFLQQALLNLALNSMEAIGTRADGRIEMQAGEGKPGHVEISVGDNGCGVPPEKFSSLVEPFFTTKRDGLGMGLPLVQSIAEQHGGKLRLANQPGRGLAVYLTLPAHEG